MAQQPILQVEPAARNDLSALQLLLLAPPSGGVIRDSLTRKHPPLRSTLKRPIDSDRPLRTPPRQHLLCSPSRSIWSTRTGPAVENRRKAN